MDEYIFVGIDVAKDQIDVCLQPGDLHRTFPNAKTGFDEPQKLLGPKNIALAIMESTGGLEIPVAAALGCAGIPIAIVNPYQASMLCVTVTRRRAATRVRSVDPALCQVA